MKPPILTNEETDKSIRWIVGGTNARSEAIRYFGVKMKEQRDKDYEHEQQTVREIFEEIEKRWKHYKYGLVAGTRKEETYFIMCSDNPEWEVFKSRFLEEK